MYCLKAGKPSAGASNNTPVRACFLLVKINDKETIPSYIVLVPDLNRIPDFHSNGSCCCSGQLKWMPFMVQTLPRGIIMILYMTKVLMTKVHMLVRAGN